MGKARLVQDLATLMHPVATCVQQPVGLSSGSPVLNPSVRKFWKICFKVVIFQNQDAQVKSEDAVLI